MPLAFLDRLRTRVPSAPAFLRRAWRDPRHAVYDLLPLVPSPRHRARLARLAAATRRRTPDFQPSAAAQELAAALRRDGLATALPPVDPAIVAELRRHFETIPCRDPYRPHLGAFRFDAPPSPDSNMGYFDVDQILSTPHAMALFNDPRVLEAAELHLGCKPLIDNVGCWWSFPERAAAKGTQRFHRDYDSLGGFKLFIYLTDVDATGGPHVFVRGSHTDERLTTPKAMSDAEVGATFGPDAATVLTGPAGTRFVADTYGVHKGLLPVGGRRLLLTCQYTVNRTPHGPRQPIAERPAGYCPWVNRVYLR